MLEDRVFLIQQWKQEAIDLLENCSFISSFNRKSLASVNGRESVFTGPRWAIAPRLPGNVAKKYLVRERLESLRADLLLCIFKVSPGFHGAALLLHGYKALWQP